MEWKEVCREQCSKLSLAGLMLVMGRKGTQHLEESPCSPRRIRSPRMAAGLWQPGGWRPRGSPAKALHFCLWMPWEPGSWDALFAHNHLRSAEHTGWVDGASSRGQQMRGCLSKASTTAGQQNGLKYLYLLPVYFRFFQLLLLVTMCVHTCLSMCTSVEPTETASVCENRHIRGIQIYVLDIRIYV